MRIAEKERSKYIDADMSQRLHIMKLILMIMVVYGHSYALPKLSFDIQVPELVENCKNIVRYDICSVAVPSFFLISGILLFSKSFNWAENMKKKVKSILIPYFIINTFWIVFFKLMQAFESTKAYFSDEAYQIYGVEGLLRAYLDPIPLYYPFWFLRDLFIVNVFAKILDILIERVPAIAVILIFAIELHVLPVPFVSDSRAFSLFLLGGILVRYRIKIWRRIPLWIVITGYVMAIVIKILSGSGEETMILYVICGFIFWYEMAGIIAKSRLSSKILKCADFSFFIYAFHEYYEAMIKKVIMSVLPQNTYIQLAEFFILPLIISCICIVVGVFMKRWLNPMYRLICGGRN